MIGGQTHPVKAPGNDDLFDAVLLLSEDLYRIEDMYIPDNMLLPDECKMDLLCNQTKLSPQELVECFPCVCATINPEFVFAIEGWFQSGIQMLATHTHSVCHYINFQLDERATAYTRDPFDIKEAEKMQSKLFLTRNREYLHLHWAKRDGKKMTKGLKRPQTASQRALKTLKQQIKENSGVDLILPKPIGRSFNEIQDAWTKFIKPERMVVFPPRTEFEYAAAARIWLMEIEATLFGEALNSLANKEKENQLNQLKSKSEEMKAYQDVVREIGQPPR